MYWRFWEVMYYPPSPKSFSNFFGLKSKCWLVHWTGYARFAKNSSSDLKLAFWCENLRVVLHLVLQLLKCCHLGKLYVLACLLQSRACAHRLPLPSHPPQSLCCTRASPKNHLLFLKMAAVPLPLTTVDLRPPPYALVSAQLAAL